MIRTRATAFLSGFRGRDDGQSRADADGLGGQSGATDHFPGLRLGLVLAFCGTLVSALLPAQLQRPVYEVFRTGVPIKVDGELDEPFWEAAPAFRFVDNLTGADSTLETRAWAGFDDRFLYFAFQTWDVEIWSTLVGRDEHLWTEEVVEVFLQADPAHPSYIELEVNPLGAMLDIFLLDVRKPLPYASWNSRGLRWAVRVEGTVDERAGDRSWTCEIALPLEDVVTSPHNPPREGDRWRLNLYRVDQRPVEAHLAWSPTRKPDFHLPEQFGEIVFSARKLP